MPAVVPFLVNPPRYKTRRRVKHRVRRRQNRWRDDKAGHRRAAKLGWRRRKAGRKRTYKRRSYGKRYKSIARKSAERQVREWHRYRQLFGNPLGGGLMIAGNRVKRRKRKKYARRRARRRNVWYDHSGLHRRAAKKGWRRRVRKGYKRKHRAGYYRRRRNPVMLNRMYNRRPRRRHRRYGHIIRRRYHRNPAAVGSIRGFQGLFREYTRELPIGFTIGASIVVTEIAPGFFPTLSANMAGKYAIQAGSGLAGGFLLGMFKVQRRHVVAWMAASIGVIVADLLKTYLVPMLPAALHPVSDYSVRDYMLGAETVDRSTVDYGANISAFPDTLSGPGVGAYPDVY